MLVGESEMILSEKRKLEETQNKKLRIKFKLGK